MNRSQFEDTEHQFKPGDKVIVWVSGVHQNSPEPGVRTIKQYHEDLCGEGCCDGYELDGEPMVAYREGQLEAVK